MDTRLLAAELATAAVVYGLLAMRRGGTHPWPFLAGVAAVAAALVSPLHGVAERSLAGHMMQHVLLVSVAAPLLAAGRPLDLVLRRRTPSWQWLAAAAVVQVVALLGWHAPVLFDAAVEHPLLHEVEHATLLLSAFALWDALVRQRGGAVVALFVASLPPMAYGVALSLARTPWYGPYPSLPSQQLAGVVMWAYGGLAAVAGGVALGVEWLRAAERTAPGWGGAA
jgi:cytochrome c oxidase assembly factor CtaG